MTIRFLTKEDVLSYRTLRQYSLMESPFAFSDSYEDQQHTTVADYEQEIEKWGDPLESFALGAFHDPDELIGFLKFKRDQRSKARHRASFHSLYVKPVHRGKGIASQLLCELLKIIDPIPGLEQLQLSTIVSHTSLVEFYERSGFQKLGGLIEHDLIIKGVYVDAWYMVKHLKQRS